MYKIEAIMPLPEKIGEHKLLPPFYQQLVNKQHDVMEKTTKKVGRGYKEHYNIIGGCKCAVRGKMVYIDGIVSRVPENTKYLRLAITADSNIYFLFTEEGGVLTQPNFKFKEV